jgi:peptide/nickel transport system substrate-binding protein
MPVKDIQGGGLAENWEMPDPDTIIYHIRQGVHWHDKAPTNGREMTADDVAFSLNRWWDDSRSYGARAYSRATHLESITAADKWTVVFKAQPGKLGSVYEMASGFVKIFPRDAVEFYGNMEDWKNSIGTGAYMLADYVRDSSATLVRNPNYWMKDPLHPENQLPYLDGVKFIIIPDLSTRMSAIRTGKVDFADGLSWENGEELMTTAPELKYREYLPDAVPTPAWRVDKPELPFYDIRVRHALYMAIDNQEMVDDYYRGHADIMAFPTLPTAEYADMYIPVEELPESTRKLFEYHPDEARQLLAEAGYPDGFKTSIVLTAANVDMMSIIKDYWADVGVELELIVKEPAAFSSIAGAKSYTDMITLTENSSKTYKLSRQVSLDGVPVYANYSMIDDPIVNQAYSDLTAAYFDEPRKRELLREIGPYLLEKAYHLVLPTPMNYTFWQPWVKNYNGELVVGYWASYLAFPMYIWVDQDLKEEMTGRR